MSYTSYRNRSKSDTAPWNKKNTKQNDGEQGEEGEGGGGGRSFNQGNAEHRQSARRPSTRPGRR